MDTEYNFNIELRPDYSLLRVKLREGQKIFAEPSAMATMDTCIKLKAGFKGGVMSTLKRGLGGESLIINTFTADQEGEVTFAPGPMGDLNHYAVNGTNLLLQSGAFVAHGEGLEVTGKFDGVKGFFSGQGIFLLQASGTGDIFFNTYGAMIEIDVNDGFIVDTGYVVAFESTLDYQITTVPGLSIGSKVKTFLFGGEGLVCKFNGQGKVWIQTRTINPFLRWVHPYRRVQNSSH
ncbi:MAG: TIGR00266 family protein [Myxococcota bacterium]|nr:TIGR00266 family protein [Myxococcota bacterium]